MHTDDMPRERQLNIRMNEEEAARFARVAAHYTLNAAQLIRMLVKREDDAITATVREVTGAMRGGPKRGKSKR